MIFNFIWHSVCVEPEHTLRSPDRHRPQMLALFTTSCAIAGWHSSSGLARLGGSSNPLVSTRVPAAIMQTGFMSKVKEINEANKQKMVKVGAKPVVGPKRMPPEVLELTKKFKKEYTTRELDALWGAMMACYGKQDLAVQAAFENPQIVNPSYSFVNTMVASKEVLFDMFGKEEALEVMLKNPAVLQCGPSLDTLGPDEVKGFANIRYFGNKIPESARLAAVCGTIILTLAPVLLYQGGLQDTPVAMVIRPLVGILFAVAIEGSRIAIVGTIVKAKMSGDERIKIAEANEKRRMGKK